MPLNHNYNGNYNHNQSHDNNFYDNIDDFDYDTVGFMPCWVGLHIHGCWCVYREFIKRGSEH